ncbi:MAG: ATP-grasp domain-containing protein, partial [Kiritimatiellae bacterium]|nr:ATP-grasp domain-containing protein [Kiritimatiellia bacterium]
LASLAAAAARTGAALVVPTIDTELPLLARRRQWLEERCGATILVSSPECVETCFDKGLTALFLSACGIPGAATWRGRDEAEAARPPLPLVVKPARGSSSHGVFVVRTARELDFFLDVVEDPVVQALLDGQEYTIDALLDFDGGYVAAVPRRRLAVRDGEILKGMIDLDGRVTAASRRLLAALGELGAAGPLTLQGFLCRDGEFRFTEVNPRLGGGAPMTFAAGADYPGWLCSAATGRPAPDIPLDGVRDGALFTRFDTTIEVTRGSASQP